MKKQTIAIVGIIGVIALSVGYVLVKPDAAAESGVSNTQQASAQTASPTPQTVEEQTISPGNAPAQATLGKYVTYSADAAKIAEGRRVLFFHAAWCPQCRALEKDITAKGVPVGMTILKVDFDTSQALRKKYGVTQQTTFVELNSDDSLKTKFVAYDEPTQPAVLKALGE